MAPIFSFFFTLIVTTYCFEDIFVNGQSLVSKWGFEEPNFTFVDETNAFTLTYAVDDSITQANTISAVYEKGCMEEGNELLAIDGIEGIKTAVDTIGEATLSFKLNPKILVGNSNIYTAIPDEARGEMLICARFMLQTDDGSVKVNYLESVIQILFDLSTGLMVEGFSVTSKGKASSGNATKSYDVNAYLCNPSFPETQLNGNLFSQGSLVSVCVTPTQAAIDEGVLMKSIDSFNWAKGSIEQPAVTIGAAASNQLSYLSCQELSLHCTLSTVLYADFFVITKEPSSSPSALLADYPTSSPTVYVNQTLCEETAQSVETTLDFFQSIEKQSDIHLGGELRYGNIGSINGQEVDLLVTATDYLQPDYKGGGKDSSGTFGQLSVKAQKDDPTAGEGTFQFCFVEPDTYTEVTASSFQWSVFDIDNRVGEYAIREKLTMDTTQAESFALWPNEEESELYQYCENDGSAPPCDEGTRTIFEATTEGVGQDNPNDPNNMTDQQKKRSIVFTFKNKSCWTVIYSVYCSFEPERECRSYTGARLLFAGGADEVTQTGETKCAPERRNLGKSAEEARNLEEFAIIEGYGTATLAFGNRGRRHLSKDGRMLQATGGLKSDIDLSISIIMSDDDIGRSKTAGGANTWESLTMVFISVLVHIVVFILIY